MTEKDRDSIVTEFHNMSVLLVAAWGIHLRKNVSSEEDIEIGIRCYAQAQADSLIMLKGICDLLMSKKQNLEVQELENLFKKESN